MEAGLVDSYQPADWRERTPPIGAAASEISQRGYGFITSDRAARGSRKLIQLLHTTKTPAGLAYRPTDSRRGVSHPPRHARFLASGQNVCPAEHNLRAGRQKPLTRTNRELKIAPLYSREGNRTSELAGRSHNLPFSPQTVRLLQRASPRTSPVNHPRLAPAFRPARHDGGP